MGGESAFLLGSKLLDNCGSHKAAKEKTKVHGRQRVEAGVVAVQDAGLEHGGDVPSTV